MYTAPPEVEISNNDNDTFSGENSRHRSPRL